MASARSLAASVAALGFASTVFAPLPAFAATPGSSASTHTRQVAPAPCGRAERYAAQAEAELLRVERVDLRGGAAREDEAGTANRKGGERPSAGPEGGERPSAGASESAEDVLEQLDDRSPGAAGRGTPGKDVDPAAGGTGGGTQVGRSGSGDGAQSIGGVGIGAARSVMIADAPVRSAASGQVLDGRVDGAPAAGQVLQQAPPTHDKPVEQHSGPKRFGPIQVGGATMSAHARWDPAIGCGAARGEISRSSTDLESVTLTGDLVRVPEKVSSSTSTALSRSGGAARANAWATVSAGRIELAGGRVRIRMLRAPTLRVGMSAAEGGEVRFQPAVVEVSGPGIARTRLDTGSDQVDVAVRNVGRVTESATAPVPPPERSPLPSIPGLPAPSGGSGGGAPVTGTTTGGKAPTAGTSTAGTSTAGTSAAGDETPVTGTSAAGEKAVVRVSLGDVRQASKGHALAARATAIKVSVLRPGKAGYRGSTVVAELGIGVLEAAAVAPDRGRRTVATGIPGGTLPVTGPPVVPLLITAAGLLVGGVCAVLLGSRRRRGAA
ncbi:hypothetical protein [Actinoplanes siamensis]|uniref:Uncharacterized protein n=1 Tax=Actinoplanes siamensis TaxID=1223317 RepID=A0A919TK76_9ACTN|nr:hypothetical protein [Actinoplanes siamensis]GIF05317.1 hypothetical protein Asi03nite_28550 [Actinoplanes siamensis]